MLPIWLPEVIIAEPIVLMGFHYLMLLDILDGNAQP